jgi:acetylornithine deacetylase/succinyl-diaminopimelate desuccinylase-like protein
MKNLSLLMMLLTSVTTFSQSAQTFSVRKYIDDHKSTIMREFTDFLSIPNVASDSINIRKNAAFIMEMMRKRNIQKVQLLEHGDRNVPPVVYGEVMIPGATQTLIFYAHYDGQPVNPLQWAEGLEPFTPALFTDALGKGSKIDKPVTYESDYRLYGRGSSDDKAGVLAILNAFEALSSNQKNFQYNIKFFFEGEEEAGSPHLSDILKKYSSLLKSDLWIICDGPVHQSGKKVVCFGVRGDAHVDVTVYGPKRPLHSGHYGNWAPNPGMMLAKLLSSMKDDDGKVTIKGFNDDVKPLTASEMDALRKIPMVDDQIRRELGLLETENKGKTLAETINLPSLNINGMQSGNVGKMASNQIPTTANAVLDLRLVLGNHWQRQQEKVVEHIRSQGYYVIDREPTDEERTKYSKVAKVIKKSDGYNAQRTSMDMPIAATVARAVAATTTEQIVLLPTMGGSLPLIVIEEILGAKTIIVPIANHDNNQHAENENIRLGNFFSGIETLAATMAMELDRGK